MAELGFVRCCRPEAIAASKEPGPLYPKELREKREQVSRGPNDTHFYPGFPCMHSSNCLDVALVRVQDEKEFVKHMREKLAARRGTPPAL